MAITKTTSVQRLEVYPAPDASADATSNNAHESVMVVYEDAFDDADDATLPITSTRVKHLYKFVEDGGAATDTSAEDALVQTVCTAIWA
jgi:hypothetical protein